MSDQHLGSTLPSISTIPGERSVQAIKAGKKSPGFAFANYIKNAVIVLLKCRDALNDPPSAWGTDFGTRQPIKAPRDFAINQAFAAIEVQAESYIDAWHGEVMVESERGGYVTTAKFELDAVESALRKLINSATGSPFKRYTKAHEVIARAERRIWAAIDATGRGQLATEAVNQIDSSPGVTTTTALTQDHETILAELARTPSKCRTVIDVASVGTIRNRETVGRLLKDLNELGLVNRPRGVRKGYALTASGKMRMDTTGT